MTREPHDVEDSDLDCDAILQYLNANHTDTIRLLAQFATGRVDLSKATIAALDSVGCELSFLPLPIDGAAVHRLDFTMTATTSDDVRSEVFALVRRARAAAEPAEPTTSLERIVADVEALPTYRCKVASTRSITPAIREITLGGGLDGFNDLGVDQYVRLLDANFTIRRYRPEDGEVDIWFVLHGRGPATAWAATARPGDDVELWGPRAAFEPPADTASYLLVSDETGLAAVASILEHLGGRVPVTVLVEVRDVRHRVDLPAGPLVEVEWTFRGAALPGTGTALLDAVVSRTPSSTGLYAFGAGEARQMATIRRHLRESCDMTADATMIGAYWRR